MIPGPVTNASGSSTCSSPDDDADRCPLCEGSFTEAFLDGRPVPGCFCDLANIEHVLEGQVGMEAQR